MLNLKTLFPTRKSQVAPSQELQSHQSQLWKEISDTPAESIQGGWSDPNNPYLPIPIPVWNVLAEQL